MAIDFMIMPISRYVSGDFITPMMRFSWETGVPYTIFGPNGPQQFPKDVPFGGPDAATKRSALIDAIMDDLRSLPMEERGWDELSSEEPCFHRVNPASYEALLDQATASAAVEKSSWFGLLKKRRTLHVTASLFLPCDLESPFDMRAPLEDRLVGATSRALEELERGHWSDAAMAARDTLEQALRDSVRLRLPMIVDT